MAKMSPYPASLVSVHLSNVKISSRRGVWGNRVSPRPRPAGEWGNRVSPFPARVRVWEGKALPGTTVCSSRRCARIAWTAEVTIVRRVQPPSQPPPAGGRSRVPGPQRGRAGEGGSHLRCNGLPLEQGYGETWFPHTLVHGRVRAQPSSRGVGKPGFPILSPRGRVWAGVVLRQGAGETRFPHPLTNLSFPARGGGTPWRSRQESAAAGRTRGARRQLPCPSTSCKV